MCSRWSCCTYRSHSTSSSSKIVDVSYLLADHLGATTVVMDEARNTVASRKYWPYGGERSVSGDQRTTDLWYTGQREEDFDGLGLYNYNARFYSTTLGRFVSADPIAVGGPQGLNPYSYVLNNPLAYVDPTGMYIDTPGDSAPGCDAACASGKVRRAEEREKAEIARRTGEAWKAARAAYIGAEWKAARDAYEAAAASADRNVLPALAMGSVAVTLASPIPGVDETIAAGIAGGLLLCSANAQCKGVANDLLEGLGTLFASDEDWDDPLEHPEILTGLSPEEVEEYIPAGWTGEPTPDERPAATHAPFTSVCAAQLGNRQRCGDSVNCAQR
jgi:RHS repeat-associated protein